MSGPTGPRPMRILIMGDFTAAAQTNTPGNSTPIVKRKLYPVDIDNLDQLFRKLPGAFRLASGRSNDQSHHRLSLLCAQHIHNPAG